MENKHLKRLIKSHYPLSPSGELSIAGQPVTGLAKRYGTPLYAYDAAVLDSQYNRLRDIYPKRFEIYYSIKANPHPAFLQHFLSKGCGLEIASRGELERALSAGCPTEKIIYAGPGKTEADLEAAIATGIGEIHAESLTEIRRIDVIARSVQRRVAVALRINPEAEVQGGAMRMGGKPSPFGIDEAMMPEALMLAATLPGIDLEGIHLFIGTQNLDAKILIAQYRKGIEIALRAAEILGHPLRSIDFGGGLGIPYFSHEKALDETLLKTRLNDFTRTLAHLPALRNTRFIIEPGRFLAGPSGIYLCRITDIKISRGKKFLVVDGGMHHHLAASGNLGQTIKRNYPVAVVNRMSDAASDTVDVVGPLCTPLDVLARNIALPKTKIGDLIGVFQSGAYGLTASPRGFLSHEPPAEIWLENGQHIQLSENSTPKAELQS